MRTLGNYNVYLKDKIDHNLQKLKPDDMTMPKFIAKIVGDFVKGRTKNVKEK